MLPCGCSGNPVTRVEVVRVRPPAVLLEPVPEPEPPRTGATNGDLMNYTLDLQDALAAAQADKDAIRKFVAGMDEGDGE